MSKNILLLISNKFNSKIDSKIEADSMKEDMSGVKEDVSGLKENIDILNEDMAGVKK